MTAKFVNTKKTTRADRLRQQREKKNSRPVEVTVEKTETPVTPPVEQPDTSANQTRLGSNVFARPISKTHGADRLVRKMKIKPRGKRNASKRLTIPLNKQGAELQLSTLPLVRFGWRGASGLIFIVLFIALIVLLQQKVEGIQFIGIQDSLASDVENVLNLNGKTIFSIDPEYIKRKMDRAFPKLTDVKVSIQLPAKVILSAKERTPVYAWVNGTFTYLIDNENLIYPASPGENVTSLMLITADTMPPEVSIVESSNDIIQDIMDDLYPYDSDEDQSTENTTSQYTYTVDGKIIATIEQIIPYLPQESSLIYSQEHGFGWQTKEGCDTYFGIALEDMPMKLAMVRAIEQSLVLNNIKATLISVEYLHAPYYREE